MNFFEIIQSWFKPAKLQVSREAYDFIVKAIQYVKENNKDLYMGYTVLYFDDNNCGTTCCLYGWLPAWHPDFKWTPDEDYPVTPSWWDFNKSLTEHDWAFMNLNFLFDGAVINIENKKLQKKLKFKLPNHQEAKDINFVENRFNEIMQHVDIID
jgi:hypothetical protein